MICQYVCISTTTFEIQKLDVSILTSLHATHFHTAAGVVKVFPLTHVDGVILRSRLITKYQHLSLYSYLCTFDFLLCTNI